MVKKFLDYLSKVRLEFDKIQWLKGRPLMQLLMSVLMITILSSCFFIVIDMIASSLIFKIF